MTVSQPLQRPFERLMRAMSKHLSRAIAGDVEPLHQGRVATRRLREILPLCACEVSRGLANRTRRRARRVGRALGDVREIDVSIGVVEALSQGGTVDEAAGHRLKGYLMDEREERRERMLDRLSSINHTKLERDLADVARQLGMRQQTDAWAQTLALRIDRRSESVQEAVGEAGALYISDRVHRVRIATKKLRYTLELAADAGEAQTRSFVRQLKGVQQVLGRLHDLEVLGRMIQDLTIPVSDAGDEGPVALVRPIRPISDELDALRKALGSECRELHSRYVGKRETLLEVCRDTVALAARVWTERGGELSRIAPGVSTGRVLRMTVPVPPSATRKVVSGER